MNTEPQGSPLKTVFDTRAGGKWFAILVAVMPSLLFAFLSIVNPAYMSHFFLADVRAEGLSILGLVVLLSVLSYALLRRCASIIEFGRRLQGTVLATVVMALVVFPAALLVVLGPAGLILLGADL